MQISLNESQSIFAVPLHSGSQHIPLNLSGAQSWTHSWEPTAIPGREDKRSFGPPTWSRDGEDWAEHSGLELSIRGQTSRPL